MNDIKHKFEIAGLGIAPFKNDGYAELVHHNGDGTTKAGGSCDFCSASIRDAFYIKSADGRRFKVGSDCINKIGDKGLVDLVKRQVNLIKTQRRHAAEHIKIQAGRKLFEAHREVFAAMPPNHPWYGTGHAEKTLADDIRWSFEKAGNAGKLQTIKQVTDTLKTKGLL